MKPNLLLFKLLMVRCQGSDKKYVLVPITFDDKWLTRPV